MYIIIFQITIGIITSKLAPNHVRCEIYGWCNNNTNIFKLKIKWVGFILTKK